jgi:hypothetical protein
MACSSRPRVQVNSYRHKNPSRGSKPWIFGKKYSVFKFLDHGDERHSKNSQNVESTKNIEMDNLWESCASFCIAREGAG